MNRRAANLAVLGERVRLLSAAPAGTITGMGPREEAIDAAMRSLYGTHGPDEDIDADSIRRILGTVFDAGARASQ